MKPLLKCLFLVALFSIPPAAQAAREQPQAVKQAVKLLAWARRTDGGDPKITEKGSRAVLLALRDELAAKSREYLALQNKEEVTEEDLARVLALMEWFNGVQQWAYRHMLAPPKDMDALSWEVVVRAGVLTSALQDHFNLTVYVATQMGKDNREKIEKELGVSIEDHWSKVVNLGLMGFSM